MRITFYGVRGSIPVSSAETLGFGGNTSCVHIKLDNGKNIVFDAGTGIRQLGQKLALPEDPVFLLITHSHWDHIHGFPFFAPIYQKERQVSVYFSEPHIHGELCSLLNQMDGAHFPIDAQHLPSKTTCITKHIEQELRTHDIDIRRKALNHPGGGHAYRIAENGVSCAYVTDNELEPPGKIETTYKEWVEFCYEVDLLIHDAQYTESDMPQKHGWGHSLASQAMQLALDAEVGSLALFHHDPDRSDFQLEKLQREAQSFLTDKGVAMRCFCAREGLVMEI
jgi:phosphoribosyl 1,2-cyclic phosphodiesterase